MVTIGMNYKVIAGKEQIFERAFEQVLKTMDTIDGHSRSFLYCDVKDKLSYLIISEWSEKGAFDEFIRSEAFAKVTNWGKEQILTARPSHQVYNH